MKTTHEYMRINRLISIVFIIGIFTAVCPLEEIEGETRRHSMSVSGGGRTAWAVGLEIGPVAVSEIWIATGGGAPRRLGIFPGLPGSLAWVPKGDRLQYREASLGVALYSLSIVPQRSVPLVSPGAWEISIRDGSVRRVAGTRIFESGMPSDVTDVGSPVPSKGARAVLSGVAAAFKATALAYSTLHRWDFEEAEDRYRKAAKAWEALPARFRKQGLFREPVMGYVRTLGAMATEARETTGARWVCRDHLTVIGDLLQAYEEGHDGQRPAGLDGLKTWVESHTLTRPDSVVLKTLFRSPADPEGDRRISYTHGYQPEAVGGEAVLTSFFHGGHLVEIFRSGAGYRTIDRRVGDTQVDSLLTLGMELTLKDPLTAISTLEILAGVAPRFAEGHSKLGFAYLEVGKLVRAIDAFERAIDCDHTLAEAYYGLGLTFRRWPRGSYDAIRYFQTALQYRRDYVEARYNIAEIRHELKEHDARLDLEKLMAIDPRYAPAYLLMGKWYEEFEKDYENAALYYARYLSLAPHDPEGRKRLAAVYLETRNYARIAEMLQEYALEHPDDIQILPILAQACVRLEAFDRAEAFYRDYLEAVDEAERAHYEDIRLVTSSQALAAFERTPQWDRRAFLDSFWSDRDPDLTTAANERRLEHYRRVWYAMQNFSEGKQPWDQRGEVYIRFGEPDHRSRSDNRNFQQSLAVQRIKERLSTALYGAAVPSRMFLKSETDLDGIGNVRGDVPIQTSGPGATYAGPVYPVRSHSAMSVGESPGFSAEYQGDGIKRKQAARMGIDRTEQKDQIIGAGRGSGRLVNFKPVTSEDDASIVPWETWVYVNVGGGIEITFTDEFHNGTYNYAPAPLDARIPSRQQAMLNRYNPHNVYRMAAAATPDYYVPLENEDPIEFYFDSADFRSYQGFDSALEVYAGIPRHQGHYLDDDDRTKIEADRTVALLNRATGAVYRSRERIRFAARGDLTAEQSAFVPDVARMDVPAGLYRMEIKMKDRLSPRHARYRQDVEVEPYDSTGLQVSDLEMAWRISNSKVEDKFSKGTLWVIPMPTRTYAKGQSVFVYYEIYNLSKDEFGQTNYKVSYTVTSNDKPGAVGIITSLTRWSEGKHEELSVTYEQHGTDAQEAEYVELKLENRPAGKYQLKVTVTDVNAGEAVEKDAGLVIAE